MASKLVKNAMAPTAPATAAMLVTTAAWKRRSHASAAWTLGSVMLGGRSGCGFACIVSLRWVGPPARRRSWWWASAGAPWSADRRRWTAAEHDRGDRQAQPRDRDRPDDGGHRGEQRGDQRDDGHDRAGGHTGDGEHQRDGGGGVHPAEGLQRQDRRGHVARLGLVDVVDLHWRARALVGWLQHGGSSRGQLELRGRRRARMLSAHGRPPLSCWTAGRGRARLAAGRPAGPGWWPGAGGCGRRPRGAGSAPPGRRAGAGGPPRGPGRPVW